jgi:16S rRNA (guanine966-N2)-methyltransferase
MLTARFDFADARILDLFAGSGALGFEALSRGAATVVFVDSSRAACASVRANATALGVLDEIQVVCRGVDKFLATISDAHQFDFIFADPPYDADARVLPDCIPDFLRPGGVFALEHDGSNSFEETDGHIVTRAFGRTRVSLFANP